jgi:hypothetical protein
VQYLRTIVYVRMCALNFPAHCTALLRALPQAHLAIPFTHACKSELLMLHGHNNHPSGRD